MEKGHIWKHKWRGDSWRGNTPGEKTHGEETCTEKRRGYNMYKEWAHIERGQTCQKDYIKKRLLEEGTNTVKGCTEKRYIKKRLYKKKTI